VTRVVRRNRDRNCPVSRGRLTVGAHTSFAGGIADVGRRIVAIGSSTAVVAKELGVLPGAVGRNGGPCVSAAATDHHLPPYPPSPIRLIHPRIHVRFRPAAAPRRQRTRSRRSRSRQSSLTRRPRWCRTAVNTGSAQLEVSFLFRCPTTGDRQHDLAGHLKGIPKF
jgi:hypothetical protein